MKRYLLFAGDACYPNGGWENFVGSYDIIPPAPQSYDWWHVVDTCTMKVVASCYAID